MSSASPYIVSDVLKHGVMNEKVKLKTYIVNLAYGLKPMATLKIEINGQEFFLVTQLDNPFRHLTHGILIQRQSQIFQILTDVRLTTVLTRKNWLPKKICLISFRMY